MKFYTEALTLQDSTTQVLDIFGQTEIYRYHYKNNGEISRSKKIKVPCLYNTRSRIQKSIESKTGTHTIPFIGISTGSISVDSARIHSSNEGVLHQLDGKGYDADFTPPVPINVEYNMTIVARYHSDIDQIVSSFIPHFRPDISVIIQNPKIENNFIKTSLEWDLSCNYEFPEEIAESDVARIIVTTSFVHKTFLWAGIDKRFQDPSEVSGNNFISSININDGLINPYGMEYGSLEHFYDVPNNMPFDEYVENIKAGKIKKDGDRLNWDIGQSITGDINGNISAIIEEVPEHRQTKNWNL